jgi:hypothetical protein
VVGVGAPPSGAVSKWDGEETRLHRCMSGYASTGYRVAAIGLAALLPLPKVGGRMTKYDSLVKPLASCGA